VSKKLLTAENGRPDTILKLEFGHSVDELALAAPSQGSLTSGKNLTNGEVNLGQPVTFDRLEFTMDNPGYRRGQGRDFQLQARLADGSWQMVHHGKIFGSIYSKQFDPLTAQFVRLDVGGVAVPQFDLFPPSK
jgi:hypothetical protein